VEGFKVVDFEKCYYGPSGIDLGIFLSNYLWYYAAHPNPISRRSLSGGASAVIESYKQAFIVQVIGVTQEQHSELIDIDSMLNDVCACIYDNSCM
jgi:5-methylthioribose kinase